jgi:hypothetical protein
VLVKRAEESGEHVAQKALLWALHLPEYPGLAVEQRLPFPSRYTPDLFALAPTGDVAFWGECGAVGAEKLRVLFRKYPATRFVFSKWATRLEPHAALVEAALAGVRRTGRVELLGFPADAADWLADGREPTLDVARLDVRRWG